MPGGTLPVIDTSEIEKWNYATPFSPMYPATNLINKSWKFSFIQKFLNREGMPIKFNKGSALLLFVYAWGISVLYYVQLAEIYRV
jgi:hypothetical protein